MTEYDDEIDRYRIKDIGRIEMGCDGSDQYLLVRDLEQEINEQDVYNHMMSRYYRETDIPGAYFCMAPRIIPDPLLKDRCIVIIQHRYDN